MTYTPSRRDLVFGIGGAAAGLAVSPVPWRLVNEVALWSQHRHSIPVPGTGEITYKASACTLCPGGCALRVRCVAGRPVSTMGEPGHPHGAGACALGLAIHHLAHHPLRLREPLRRNGERLEAVGADAALGLVAEALADARRCGMAVAVLDQRPGRVLSRAYREWMAAVPGGHYLTLPGEGATLDALAAMCASPDSLGLDLERTATLVAFGAPVLEGWGQPGRILARRGSLRVVAIDTWSSPTAALADEAVRVRPGTEGVFASGLCHLLARQGGAEIDPATRARLEAFTPAQVEQICGVEARRTEALARSLAATRPAVAVGGGDAARGPMRRADEQAIALLNVLLGSLGTAGGIVVRRAVPDAAPASASPVADLQSIPEGTLRVLVLDADSGRGLPWGLVAPRLAPDALVVGLSAFRFGLAERAHLILPVAAPLEGFDEVLPTADATVASFGLAAPVLEPSEGCLDPAEIIARLAQAGGLSLASPRSHEQLLKQRVAAIAATGRGLMVVRTEKGFEQAPPGTADQIWEQLGAGGRWVDAPVPNEAIVARTEGLTLPSATASPAAASGLRLLPVGVRGAVGSTPLAPILSKLYQESDLRPAVGDAALHPQTARELGLRAQEAVRLENEQGWVLARVRLDTALPVGCVALAAGPSPAGLHPNPGRSDGSALTLCAPDAEGVWNLTSVRVRKA